ncbi:MAG: hypothetical protein G01um101448_1200 [Parcubacteria group bacterium Gr01-1014_48]|nr:MAG: hypothetical protein Greene041614_288 [Parcubacteria group bacterium Greene0416_14]TSC71386.1 MAG: hypothetical protein G01um101448_1200 [Parcubacteria group bacterium Gr01-1014_48]TSD01729.1 MAG: hypothetical protein Greene101415_127 [Parcubacteria group bacterium Greene1014_15]TSD06788.1 MAG: hypothetical protein Greene07144_1100 [Parcubacteria group bacterium Greene0714_4]
MSVTNGEILENMAFALDDLNDSFARRKYKNIPKIWDEIWFIVRADSNHDALSALRERFGREVGRLITTTRLHIKQKRISGDVSSRLQSIAAKISR